MSGPIKLPQSGEQLSASSQRTSLHGCLRGPLFPGVAGLPSYGPGSPRVSSTYFYSSDRFNVNNVTTSHGNTRTSNRLMNSFFNLSPPKLLTPTNPSNTRGVGQPMTPGKTPQNRPTSSSNAHEKKVHRSSAHYGAGVGKTPMQTPPQNGTPPPWGVQICVGVQVDPVGHCPEPPPWPGPPVPTTAARPPPPWPG